MARSWVRQEVAKLLDGLDGSHDTAMVAAVALLGPEGFDFAACEQSTNFDPAEYGPAMLEGFTMIAGAALARTLNVVHAAHQHEHHFIHGIEDEAQRIQKARNQYEQSMRQFMESMIVYAGGEFQADKQGGMSTGAGSQMLNLWRSIFKSTIQFRDADRDTPR